MEPEEACKALLMASPPGQFLGIIEALKNIVPDIATDSFIEATAIEYNCKHPRLAIAPDGRFLVVCQKAMIDSYHFLEPKSHEVFAIDPITMEINADQDNNPPPPPKSTYESHRVAIETRMEEYMKNTYFGNYGCGVYVVDFKIYVCLVIENFNSKNMWNGLWISQWIVQVNGSVRGKINIHAHYYEEANTQLQTMKEIHEVVVSKASDDEHADGVANHIQMSEKELQAGLEEMYSSMNDETFRAMRRTIPITHTKMEW